MSRISSTFGKKSRSKSPSKSLGGSQDPDTSQWTRSLRSPRSPSPSRGRTKTASTSSLRRSGSNSNLRSSGNLAASFNSSGRLSRSGSREDISGVEGDYIKNLQQQIYFLELEANHLRESGRKATELHPRMAVEAERMLSKLRTLQHDVDGLTLENHRKEANIDLIATEKQRVLERLSEEEVANAREKRLLMDEIIQLKKDNELLSRETNRKSSDILTAREEYERTATTLRAAENKIQLLRSQLDQKIEQHNLTSAALEDKRAEVARSEVTLRETEDKFYNHTVVIHDRTVAELREEIRQLRSKLKEYEIKSEEDRLARAKMSDDNAHLHQENSLFSHQTADLQKALDREKDVRDSVEQRRSQLASDLTFTKERESKLDLELRQTQDALAREQERSRQYMDQLAKTENIAASTELTANTTRSRLTELESIHRGTEDDNAQLRRDKALLVDHTSDLQKKVSEKEQEIIRLRAHVHTLQNDIGQLEHLKESEMRVQTKKWDDLTKMADSMRSMSRSMTRSGSPSPRGRTGRALYD